MHKVEILLILVAFWMALAAGEARPAETSPDDVMKAIMSELNYNGELDDTTRANLMRRLESLRDPLTQQYYQQGIGGDQVMNPPDQDDNTALFPDLVSAPTSDLLATELISERAQFYTNYTIADVRLMTFKCRVPTNNFKRTAPSQISLVTVIDTTGVLHLYSDQGAPLFTLDLELAPGATVTAVSFEGKEPVSPMIVIGASDGMLVSILVDVYYNTKLVAGRGRKRSLSKDQQEGGGKVGARLYVHAKRSLYSGVTCSRADGACRSDRAHVPATPIAEEAESEVTASGDTELVTLVPVYSGDETLHGWDDRFASAIHIYQKAGEKNSVIVVGDNYGTIVSLYDTLQPNEGQKSFLDLHDTRSSIAKDAPPFTPMNDPSRQPVLDMTRVGQILALAHGRGVRLVHIGRFRPYGYDCSGAPDVVTRVVSDPHNSLVLYAMTTMGGVTVYHVKHKKDGLPANPHLAREIQKMDGRSKRKDRSKAEQCRLSLTIRPDRRPGVSSRPSTPAEYQEWLELAEGGKPRSNFANVKGMMIASGHCGFSLYAPRNPGAEGVQAKGFVWTAVNNLDPEPARCTVDRSPLRRMNHKVMRALARVKDALPIISKKGSRGLRYVPRGIDGVAVHTLQPVKRIGKTSHLSDLVVVGYNTHSSRMSSEKLQELFDSDANDSGRKKLTVPPLVGVVTIYKSLQSDRSPLGLSGGDEGVMPSVARNINYMRPILILLVVLFVSFKVSRDRSRKRRGEENNDGGILDYIFSFFSPRSQRASSSKDDDMFDRLLKGDMGKDLPQELKDQIALLQAGGHKTGAKVPVESVKGKGKDKNKDVTTDSHTAVGTQMKLMEDMLVQQQQQNVELQAQLTKATNALAQNNYGQDQGQAQGGAVEKLEEHENEDEAEVMAALGSGARSPRNPWRGAHRCSLEPTTPDEVNMMQRELSNMGQAQDQLRTKQPSRSSMEWEKSELRDMLESERNKDDSQRDSQRISPLPDVDEMMEELRDISLK